MTDYSQPQMESFLQPPPPPMPMVSVATSASVASDPMLTVQIQADYATASYYQQQPLPPSSFYPQPEFPAQPHCLYYYPPPPPPHMYTSALPDPMMLPANGAAPVYGQQPQQQQYQACMVATMPTATVAGPASFPGAYSYPPQSAFPAPPPPPLPAVPAPSSSQSIPLPAPPSLMQQQLSIPSSVTGSSSSGACPCCSAPLPPSQPREEPSHHQQQQQQQHLHPPPPPQPQLRNQSRSSSCDSAYRTVSTSDLASVANADASNQQQQQQLRNNTEQQPQQQQQKRWKTGYLRNILYKTEMCRDVAQKGSCPRGATCQFAHSPGEMLSPREHPLYKTAFCFDFKNRGHCQRGDHCFHAHLQCELRPAPPQQQDQSAPASMSNSPLPPRPLLHQQPGQPPLHLHQSTASSGGGRRESTPRSLASTAGGSSAPPYKTLSARLQLHQRHFQHPPPPPSHPHLASTGSADHKLLTMQGQSQQLPGCVASAKQVLHFSGATASPSSFEQQQHRHRLSLSAASVSGRSGY